MDLLLEIGTEELPPGEIAPALDALRDAVARSCENSRLSIGEVRTMATPRRLALLVSDIAESAEDLEEMQVGPSAAIAFDTDGNPTRAAIGFARGKGLDPGDLSVIETDKGEYVAALVREEGQPAAEILTEILPSAIASIPWKRSMRWGWSETAFARPVKWLVALLEGEVLDFEFAGQRTHRTTYGHRFMAPEAIELTYPSAYVPALRDAHVLVDIDQRKDVIRKGIADAAASLKLNAIEDDELVEEVVQLVEWPVPLVGRFKEYLLEVPREVLVTSMKEHQRYFAFEDADGNLANAFAFVANIETDEPDIIVHGNQRVLAARLEDARFFWNEDRKRTLESRLEDLDSIRYIDGLGSIRDRADRIVKLSQWLADELFDGDATTREHAGRAALLCKTDLATAMVYEFGKLQGTMGRYYALEDGENEPVAIACEEHYFPVASGSPVASDDVAALVALADKADAIIGCFALGLIPSGSADPYGLRRAAAGLLRTLIEYDYSVDLSNLLDIAYDQQPQGKIRERDETCNEARDFILERLRTLVDAPTDVVNAVVSVPTRRIASIPQRAEVLVDLRKNAEFDELAAGFKRAVNIVTKAEQADEQLKKRFAEDTSLVDESLLADDAETSLYEALVAAENRFNGAMNEGSLEKAAQQLIALRSPIDAFFDHVMVNVDDVETRVNRLGLLAAIRRLFLRFADLSQIQVS